MDVHGHSHGGIVACAAATPAVNLRKLVVYEGWPVLDPSIYALSADVVERMDKLLAAGDQDGGVEALFKKMDMDASEYASKWRNHLGEA